LDNVLLSENLKKGDIILTKGDIDQEENGYPPDLIIGKIISVDKSPSALFQKADVVSLVDLSKLTTVFIIVK
ncbi:MAG TPA: rod shape-determining protein MreC, partial [Patescibacteria group bacterium]|nr:rod shape-determining protein MreC [Patescibacteria group bacterium]